ncbi:MAG: sugar phosphate isomerase/epimerase family protein [Phascolarctobacterium faecium]
MQWAVSDLAFGGFNKKYLSGLPLTYNIEFFYEFGTDHYWDTVLLPLAQNNKEKRTFSIHGPCVAVNLADSSDEYYLKAYAQTFTYAQKIKAEFVVVHTNEIYHGEVAAVKELVYQRLAEVISLAQSYGVQVVIENVGLRPCGSLLFDFEEYLALFERYPQALALLDTGHAHVNGWDLTNRETAAEAAVHVRDNGSMRQPSTVDRTIEWNLYFTSIRIMHRMHCRYWNMLILSREFLPNTCISWKPLWCTAILSIRCNSDF